jgi:hypothetical protein
LEKNKINCYPVCEDIGVSRAVKKVTIVGFVV